MMIRAMGNVSYIITAGASTNYLAPKYNYSNVLIRDRGGSPTGLADERHDDGPATGARVSRIF